MATYQLEPRGGSRWRAFSVHLVIFVAGALLMMVFLNYGAVSERGSAKTSLLSAYGPPGSAMSRRGLYTSSPDGGECKQGLSQPPRKREKRAEHCSECPLN
jgi:hypothetical protein